VTASEEIRRDLVPGLESAEAESLVAIGMDLLAKVPAPAPAFRGELGRRLERGTGGGLGRPAVSTPRWLGYACVGAGSILLAIPAIGLLGGGPFAPS
jgi:hypothetical protein